MSQSTDVMQDLDVETESSSASAAEDHSALSFSPRVLIVDDEPINCKVLRKYLREAGYDRLITVSQASEALDLIRGENPDLVLLDILMPEISGLAILEELRRERSVSDLPVIVLTASSDTHTKHRAFELGATDFLPKPFDPTELVARVRNAALLKRSSDRLKAHAQDLEKRVKERTAQLQTTQLEVVYCLGRAAEYRDNDTGNHVIRVGRYAAIIARNLGLRAEQVDLIELAAALHDVGKIAIPDDVLLKPGKLSAEEFEKMCRHASLGSRILKPLEDVGGLSGQHAEMGARIIGESRSPVLKLACRIALTHHERWDGSGYPIGLAGEDIPLEGRITAVADVFDALSSRRPYKAAFPREKCFEMLEEGRGTHFDPRVLDAFFAGRKAVVEAQIELADV